MTTNDRHHDWPAWRRAWDDVQQLVDTGGPMAADGARVECRNPDCAGYVDVRVRVGPPTPAEVQRTTWRTAPPSDPRPSLVFHEHHEDGCPVRVNVLVRSDPMIVS